MKDLKQFMLKPFQNIRKTMGMILIKTFMPLSMIKTKRNLRIAV